MSDELLPENPVPVAIVVTTPVPIEQQITLDEFCLRQSSIRGTGTELLGAFNHV